MTGIKPAGTKPRGCQIPAGWGRNEQGRTEVAVAFSLPLPRKRARRKPAAKKSWVSAALAGPAPPPSPISPTSSRKNAAGSCAVAAASSESFPSPGSGFRDAGYGGARDAGSRSGWGARDAGSGGAPLQDQPHGRGVRPTLPLHSRARQTVLPRQRRAWVRTGCLAEPPRGRRLPLPRRTRKEEVWRLRWRLPQASGQQPHQPGAAGRGNLPDGLRLRYRSPDMSATTFFEPLPVVDFVAQL